MMGLRTWVLVCLTALLLAPSAARAQDAEETDSAAQARAILRESLELIAGAERLGFRLNSGFDVVQASGHKLEFGAESTVTLRRPDRVRIDKRRRDGHEVQFTFDGESGTLYSPDQKVYATTVLGETVDEALDRLITRIGVPVPLSELLQSDVTSVVEERIESALYVGTSTLDGVVCEHIAFGSPEVDMQMWIERGDRPFLRRVVLTYDLEEGSPQFRADLSDWTLTPSVPDSLFAFDEPEGAQKVNFVQVAVPPAAETP
jgi:hypothetical protein